MLIYVKNIKKKKTFYGRRDGQTDGKPKTIVRNLTINYNFAKLKYEVNYYKKACKKTEIKCIIQDVNKQNMMLIKE